MRIFSDYQLISESVSTSSRNIQRISLRILTERYAAQLIASISWTDERDFFRVGAVPLPATRRDNSTVDQIMSAILKI